MNEYPVLLETRAGVVAAIVTEPDGPPRASAIFLHGAAGSRSGVNRVWARVARALASAGLAVVRLDYPGMGSSLGTGETGPRGEDLAADDAAVRDLIAWFRGRTGDLDLLAIGSCYGTRVASRLAAEGIDLAGLALLVPALQVLAPPKASQAKRIARAAKARLRPLLRRRRRRTGRKAGGGPAPERMDRNVVQAVTVAIGRTPTWVLIGEEDLPTSLFPRLERHLGEGRSRLEVEVVPGITFHGQATREAQQETIERVVQWAQRTLNNREKQREDTTNQPVG
jgi:pimeloyl-ACP methyl ester carboxylesterase